jgi:hypothetical protein
MSDSTAKSRRTLLQISPDESLPEVLSRLRGLAGKPVQLVIPDHSPILLTATEFRALKDAAARSQIDLNLETSDSLRIQLATMFDLIEGVTIARRGKQASNGAADLIPTSSGWRTAPENSATDGDDDPISVSRRRRSVMEENRRLDEPREPGRSSKRNKQPAEQEGTLDYLDKPKSSSWLTPKRLGRLVAVVIVIALVAGIAGWYYMPSVTVSATLKEQPVTGNLVYAVGLPTATLPSDVQFTIEAEKASATVNIELSVPTTGLRKVPGETATGSVVLRNPTDAAITIPAGTELRTVHDVAFATRADVEVPAASGDTPGETRIDIIAKEPGGAGNVALGALTGKFADFDVYYSNREAAIDGGTDTEIHSVTEDDVKTLEQTLTDQLRKVTADGWNQQLAEGESLVGPSVAPGEPTYEIEQQVGDEVNHLTLTGSVDATGLVFAQADIERELRAAFEGQLQAEVADGYQLLPNTIVLDDASVMTEAPDAVIYRVSASATTQATFDAAAQNDLVEQLAGEDYDTAEASVAGQPAFATASLETSPGFWPDRMPQAADRITIEIAPGSELLPAGEPTPGSSPSPDVAP